MRQECRTDFARCVVVVEHTESDGGKDAGEVKEEDGGHGLLNGFPAHQTCAETKWSVGDDLQHYYCRCQCHCSLPLFSLTN